MMRLKKDFVYQSRRKTPWDEKEQRTPMQEFLRKHYQAHYEERHPALTDTEESWLINSYIPAECPHCSNPVFKLNGYTKNRVQRYKCQSCKQTFTPVTNTIFDGHRIPICP